MLKKAMFFAKKFPAAPHGRKAAGYAETIKRWFNIQ
jgi:hypothetical protein